MLYARPPRQLLSIGTRHASQIGANHKTAIRGSRDNLIPLAKHYFTAEGCEVICLDADRQRTVR